MSVLDTMKGATGLVRQVTLCLDGAMQAEYDALQSQLAETAVEEDSLAGERWTGLAEKMTAIHDRMKASQVTFTFKGLPWMRRLALAGEHPVREGNVADRAAGHNAETYPLALIREACASVKGVDGETVTEVPDDVWDAMFAKLNFRQIDVLFTAASQANDSATTVPPSARSLLGSQDSGASSKSPGPGTSPRSGSKGGSRRGSRGTTTTTKTESFP